MHRSARTFARHYLAMVVAMLVGMGALGLLSAAGVELVESTGWRIVEMTAWMTVPMVAWMRFRGHAWRPTAEMAGSMVVPALGALVLLWTGAMTDEHGLLMLVHTVMFPAMLVVMLLRLDEYAAHLHGEPAAA